MYVRIQSSYYAKNLQAKYLLKMWSKIFTGLWRQLWPCCTEAVLPWVSAYSMHMVHNEQMNCGQVKASSTQPVNQTNFQVVVSNLMLLCWKRTQKILQKDTQDVSCGTSCTDSVATVIKEGSWLTMMTGYRRVSLLLSASIESSIPMSPRYCMYGTMTQPVLATNCNHNQDGKSTLISYSVNIQNTVP